MHPTGFFTVLFCGLSLLQATPLQADDVPAPDTVSVILIQGRMREDWPARGVVGFHRLNSAGPLVINYSLAGTAARGTDYTTSPDSTLTIPDGDREAWLEFAPTGAALRPAGKTITVTLAPGTGYTASTAKGAAAAAITLGTPSVLPNDKAALRFLLQAAFGTDSGFTYPQAVTTRGYRGWIADQFQRPLGLHQPYLNYIRAVRPHDLNGGTRIESWWNRVMGVPSLYPGAPAQLPDPLRQRIAFALSEIFVISDHLDELDQTPVGMANYYDLLVRNAFGNFRTLLYQVGTHPCMGAYLSHLQNEKGDPDEGTFADENFAREVMQLFSIGLWQLNPDGTRQLDGSGRPIPTYDNTTIANMAKVMTGFSYGGPKAKGFWDAPDNYTTPMRMWDSDHDLTAKTIVNGLSLPARTASQPDRGTAGLADYNAAIDALFYHANTAPFFSRRLIQQLVTSNPSPAYVGRVAAQFANNGRGVRGDLQAVILAVLLDPEARDPQKISDPAFGKMKEPYLRTASLMRALNARPATYAYELAQLDDIHFQQPLSARSVFNFFKPGYAPAGPVSDAGLVAPEFQILNAVTALAVPDYYLHSLTDGFNRWGAETRQELVLPQLAPELLLATDVPALMRRLDLLLTGGTLPKEQHQIIREAVEQIDSTIYNWKLERVRMAIYLIATSPESGILR